VVKGREMVVKRAERASEVRNILSDDSEADVEFYGVDSVQRRVLSQVEVQPEQLLLARRAVRQVSEVREVRYARFES
jgi:hypothetical protein